MKEQFNFQLSPKISWIIDDRNPVLRKKAVDLVLPLDHEDIEKISQMICYIDASVSGMHEIHKIRPGIAIASNQVGYFKKVIYIHYVSDDATHRYLLANPIITSSSKQMCYLTSGEGCLSVNHAASGHILRHYQVTISAFDLFSDQTIVINAEGMLAVCLQHEIDHLSGILFYDRINQDHPFIRNNKKQYIEI